MTIKARLCAVICLLLCIQPLQAVAGDALTLPESLSMICDEAFYGDASIDEVILPEGIERIGRRAFAYSAITRIELPGSIRFIADDAFYGCDLEYARVASDYCKKWCDAHGIQTIQWGSNEGEPFTDF